MRCVEIKQTTKENDEFRVECEIVLNTLTSIEMKKAKNKKILSTTPKPYADQTQHSENVTQALSTLVHRLPCRVVYAEFALKRELSQRLAWYPWVDVVLFQTKPIMASSVHIAGQMNNQMREHVVLYTNLLLIELLEDVSFIQAPATTAD